MSPPSDAGSAPGLVIDLHQDLLPHLMAESGPGPQTDWCQLHEAGVRVLIATTFPCQRRGERLSDPTVRARIDILFAEYERRCEGNEGWHVVRHRDDLSCALRSATASRGLVLAIEGVSPPPEDPWPTLDRWWSRGWRVCGLMWNQPSVLGGGPADPQRGLTQLGREVLVWARDRGLMLDLAHAGDRTFWDALEAWDGPVLVSHSNARALCDHPRNLDDRQLAVLRERDSLIGVTFVPGFLRRDRPARLSDVAAHISFLVDALGAQRVAIGSDFGGIVGRTVPDLAATRDLNNLWTVVSYDHDLAWRNAARFLEGALPRPPSASADALCSRGRSSG